MVAETASIINVGCPNNTNKLLTPIRLISFPVLFYIGHNNVFTLSGGDKENNEGKNCR
jgi:hypothetical protein